MAIHRHFATTLLVIAVASCMGASPALADPPAWAPAHGYRHKHGGYDDDSTSAPTPRPWRPVASEPRYVAGGQCNRAAAAAMLGGLIGGLAGSQVGDGNGRTAATIAGTLVGALLGDSLSRSMDQADRYCTGQALEYTPNGDPVAWQDPDRGERFTVTPTRTFRNGADRYCREYTTTVQMDGHQRTGYGTACRAPDGSWKIVTTR